MRSTSVEVDDSFVPGDGVRLAPSSKVLYCCLHLMIRSFQKIVFGRLSHLANVPGRGCVHLVGRSLRKVVFGLLPF